MQHENLEGLYFTVIGDGEAIVFLHGGPGSEHTFFLPHVLPLAKKFKLALYDQWGCGKSAPSPNNQYSMKDEVETIELLRKELNVEKVNLFGESWGSMLALLYATSYPNRVDKIMLTGVIGISAEGVQTFAQELENRLSEDDKLRLVDLEEKLRTDDATIDDITRILDRYYVYSASTLKQKRKTSLNPIVNQVLEEDIMNNYDLTMKLSSISEIPILIAQGSHDFLAPDRLKRLVSEHLPHAELIEIQNCGHWTVVEKPNEMNKIAMRFFTNI